jgi:hypothetical protein
VNGEKMEVDNDNENGAAKSSDDSSDSSDDGEDMEAEEDTTVGIDEEVRAKVKSALGDAAAHSDVEASLHQLLPFTS